MTEIILGPPGTGKTTTLLGIVEDELASGTPPDRIGYVSFTRRAAHEAVTRACERFGLSRSDMPYFSTLHSLCFRALGLSSGDVLEGKGLIAAGQELSTKITGRWTDDGTFSGFEEGDRILHMDNLARTRGIPLKQLFDQGSDGLIWYRVERVVENLRKYKAAKGLMDYTDMLEEFVRGGLAPRLDVLVVDEAQDLSQLQWRVVEQLGQHARRFCVAGDDDQAIYSFSGADVQHLIRMEGDVRVLDQSYRVPPAIQQLATGLVGRLSERREKVWHPRPGAGELAYAGGLGVIDFTTGQDTIVLARNGYLIRDQIEPHLRSQGVFWSKDGRSSVKPSVEAAIRNWEALRRGEGVPATAARSLYAEMQTGVGVARGHKALPRFQADEVVTLADLRRDGGLLTDAPWYEALSRLPVDDVRYIRSALSRGELLGRQRVRVSTIHGVKGGEADHVVLLTEIATRTHHEMRFNMDDEVRVWYVAVTRAREKLTIVRTRTPRKCPWI